MDAKKKEQEAWEIDDLELLRQQAADNGSLSAKQAYINGLEYELRAALAQPAQGEVPVLYMAVNLHNRKHYATSRSKEEAELYLIQSGLKNDGQEAAVIALYEHVAPQCGIGDGHAEFEAYAYQMGSRDFELNEFGGYKNSHTADKWWFWKSSRDELKIRFAAAPQPPADTIAVPVAEYEAMKRDAERWTSVNERLPEWPEDESERVIVFSETHSWSGSNYEILRKMDFYYHDPDMGDEEMGTDAAKIVTHWMPLPERPAKSTGEDV